MNLKLLLGKLSQQQLVPQPCPYCLYLDCLLCSCLLCFNRITRQISFFVCLLHCYFHPLSSVILFLQWAINKELLDLFPYNLTYRLTMPPATVNDLPSGNGLQAMTSGNEGLSARNSTHYPITLSVTNPTPVRPHPRIHASTHPRIPHYTITAYPH